MQAFKFPDEQNVDDPQNIEVITTQADDVEVEIVDDTPYRDRNSKPLDKDVEDPSEDEINQYSKNVQERIKELTHARHDERRAKEALAREKQELERLTQHMLDENKKLKQYVSTGTEQYTHMAKTAAEAQLEKARRDYKSAQDSYDTDAILVAQEALFEAKLRMQQAQNFQPPPLQTENYDVQPQQIESQQPQADEKTLRWQAKNQWFGANGFEEITSFTLGLHQKLVSSGVDPRTDKYFEQIDARLKSTFPDMFRDNDQRSTNQNRRPASVVAPATRSSGTRKVQLTPTQIALAKKYGLTPQQYAAEVLNLEKSNG